MAAVGATAVVARQTPRLRLLLLAPLLGGAAHAAAAASSPSWRPRPLLVTNASVIHSLDEATPSPEAFCVGTDGRFVAVGEIAAVGEACRRGGQGGGVADVEVLNAEGAVILPGLIDSHSHLLDEGRRLSIADLSSSASEQSAAEVARAFAQKHPPRPGAFVLGFGWDQNRWPGGKFPTRASLDAALPAGVPAYLDRIDGHAAWVNTAALRLGGVNRSTADPEGGRIVRDASGEPTGVLLDSAKELVTSVIPEPTKEEQRSWLLACLRECARNGLTGAHDMGQDPEVVAMYSEMAEDGSLSLRVNAHLLGRDEPGLGRGGRPTDQKLHAYRDLVTLKGVKFFLDGALGSWGAAMLQNYSDRPDLRGALRMTHEEFVESARPWLAAGWQVASHAIGDRANRVALDVYETLLAELRLNGTDHRLRVEHAQILSPEDLPRFSQLGVLPSMQPDHAMFDMPWAASRVGPERLKGAYAWKSLLDTNVRALPFGSDFPTAGVVNPWWGIYAATTRQELHGQPAGGWTPEQRVSVRQALRGYTLDAAFAAHAEALQGSISVGKYGDFVFIDRDILQVDPSQIWSTKVLGTFLGGRRVDSDAQGAAEAAAGRRSRFEEEPLAILVA